MSQSTSVKKICVADTHIDITWSSREDQTRFYGYWLKLLSGGSFYRSMAEEWTNGSNFHQDTKEIKETDQIEAAILVGDALKVSWRDGTVHVFPIERLLKHISSQDAVDLVVPVKWDARTEFDSFDCTAVMNDQAELFRLLQSFLQYGIAFLHNVTTTHEQIKFVADRLSTIDRSHLGDIFTLSPREVTHHLGETCDEIPLHIDLVYKQRPPRIQMLHVLDQTDAGGENVFVDAFSVLDQMNEEDVRLLRDTNVWFVAESKKVHFRALHPILVFDEQLGFQGVHYNGHKIVFPVGASSGFYFAFKRFQEIIQRDENKKTIQLQSGTIAIFHNLRTLHGRTAFSGNTRQFTGCFISEDDLKSKYRTIARELQILR